MTILFVILLVLAVPLWAGVAAGSLTMHQSDPAGNALAYSFTALGAGALWAMLAILVLVAGVRGGMPAWSGAMAVVLVPLSGVSAQVALKANEIDRDLKWPAIVPIAAPGLIIAYAMVCFFALPSSIAAGAIAWTAVAVLVPLPWIARARQRLSETRARKTPEQLAADEVERAAAYQQQRRDTFAALTPDSSLWEWWDFTAEDSEFRAQAHEGAKKVKSRQQDVVKMLAGGKRNLVLALPDLDLSVTPELNQAVREFLADQVKNLRPFDPSKPMPATFVTDWLEAYVPTIRWLRGNGGECDGELSAIESFVRTYPDSPQRQQFIETLRTLRRSG